MKTCDLQHMNQVVLALMKAVTKLERLETSSRFTSAEIKPYRTLIASIAMDLALLVDIIFEEEAK
jgi:hypothetical protein